MSLNWSSAARTTFSAVSPVASLITTTVFMRGRSLPDNRQSGAPAHASVVDDFRTLGVGRGGVAGEGGHDLAAAAAEGMVGARGAGLLGLAPAAERAEGVGP